MCGLLKLNFYMGVILLLEATSNFDANLWKNAKQCKLDNGANGRCHLIENCPMKREVSINDPVCDSGTGTDVCCEPKPEDFVEVDFGRVAKQECNKYMKNISWQLFGYVFGGENAREKEFTFMAALGYGGNASDVKFHCGGSLISEIHVLTAAHCLFSDDDGPVRYVLLGDLDINSTTDDAEPQYFYVKNVTVHPQYKRSSVYHDIAILHLDRPVRFSEWVQPACLDFGQLPVIEDYTNFYATGWGYIDTEGNRSTHMQEVQLIEKKFDICDKAYPINKRRLAMGLIETQMCAGGATQRKDTCQGDSGGPLTRTNDDIRYSRYKGYIVVGVTSFGKLCGFTNAPGVYTRVEKYVPWIESVVWPDEVAALGASPQIAEVDMQHGQVDNVVSGIESITPGIMESTSTQQKQQTMDVTQPAIDVQGPGFQMASNAFLKPETSVIPTSMSSVVQTTSKPVNLINIHYFSDKK